MSETLLTELVAGLCHVGRRIVRIPFYNLSDWLVGHPDLNQDGFKDWLLLVASLKDQLRKEGKVVQEVPFIADEYRRWLAAMNAPNDSPELRNRYIISLTSRDLRRLSQLAPLRAETPFGEVKVGDVIYLPVIIEDDTSHALLPRLRGRFDESTIAAIAKVLVDAVGIDLGVDEVSELRCKGLEVNIYPRLVAAADYDDGFGERHTRWLTDTMEHGLSRGLPRAKTLKPDMLPYIGLSIALWGEAAQLGNLYGVSFDVTECAMLEDTISSALSLPECECAECVLPIGEAFSGTLEYLGEDVLSDDELDSMDIHSGDDDVETLSVFGSDKRWEAASHTTAAKKCKMGVVLPFVREPK